jgi:uncharacterized membrane protein
VFANVTEAASVITLNVLLVNAPVPNILLADAATTIDVILVTFVKVIGLEKFKLPVLNTLPLMSLDFTFVKLVSLLVAAELISIA